MRTPIKAVRDAVVSDARQADQFKIKVIQIIAEICEDQQPKERMHTRPNTFLF